MSSCCGPVHGMQCIVPPHMVESMKTRGDETVRKMAEEMEVAAETYRGDRVIASPARAFMAAPTLSDAAEAAPKREVYDGGRGARLPGTLLRSEGEDPVDDEAANAAYEGAGIVFELYSREYRRDSLDGQGMPLVSTVHHRRSYNNAYWNGHQMAYGDGDGVLFAKMTELSVIGHELSHGVVQHSGGLIYRDQSGALNESFADVFGSLTLQYHKKEKAAEASWLVGEGILGPEIAGDALRSMKAPGEAYNDAMLGVDPQPYHMDLYVSTTSDNGGVHINSGIPNHAFYLLAQYLGGFAWERAGQIWYDTMQAIENPHATFVDWADTTVRMATKRYRSGSRVAKMTRRAWKLVGISV